MKKTFNFALLLFILSVSLCSPVFAQKPGKMRSIKVEPVSRATTMIGDIKVYADGINGAVVNWETTYESENLGFNVYRIDGGDDKWGTQRMVNDSLIIGSLIRFGEKRAVTDGQSYSIYDPAGRADASYYIETLDKQGRKSLFGPVGATFARSIVTMKGYNERLRPDFMGTDPSQIYQNIPAGMTPDGRTATARGAKGAKGGESVTPDPVNQQWVASQPGVRIRVNKAGMYHITKAQLQAAGFNVASSPANWQLYLNGVERKMIVEPAGEYIEFYGAGIDIENADFQIYYLIAGATAGARIPEGARIPIGPFIQGQNFRQFTTYEPRTSYVAAQIVNGDLDNWFGPVMSNFGPISRPVSIKDIDHESPDVTIKIALHGLSSNSHNVRIVMNGTFLGNLQFDGVIPFSKTFSVKASNLLEGVNTFDFIPQGSNDVNLLDNVTIDYWRLYKSDQNTLTFETQNLQRTVVTGFNTPNIRVFELNTDLENEPLLITNVAVNPGQGGSFDVSIPQGRKASMIAVNENSLLSPVSITQNSPSTISDTPTAADMLIVSHGNFMTEANTWADYRRGQGLVVDVVNVEDVYDEFDYGLPTWKAVKSYLLFAKASNANLKYVMLVGDATYDSRNYLNLGYNDLIPTKFVNTSEGESPSDETLGDANNDGVAEIAIGRLAVRDGASITLIQSKVAAFEGTVANALMNRGTLFVSDDPIGWDFVFMSHLFRDELPAGMPVNFVNAPDNTDTAAVRAQIIAGVNAGPFIVNYAGHGSTRVWSSRQLLRFTPNAPATNDLLGFNNSGGNLSLFLMLTCLNGYFVDPSDDSIAEGVVRLPTGGAPTSWASTGSTFPNIQQEMALVFFDLVGQGTYTRLGDATHAAKLNATDPEVPLTWAILGDPALKIK